MPQRKEHEHDVAGVFPQLPFDRFHTNIRNYATATGRLGFATDGWLLYVDGGYATAKVGLDAVSGVPVAGVVENSERRHDGWTRRRVGIRPQTCGSSMNGVGSHRCRALGSSIQIVRPSTSTPYARKCAKPRARFSGVIPGGESETADGFAYGGGVEYAFTDSVSLGVEYTRAELESEGSGLFLGGILRPATARSSSTPSPRASTSNGAANSPRATLTHAAGRNARPAFVLGLGCAAKPANTGLGDMRLAFSALSAHFPASIFGRMTSRGA